MGTGWIPGEDKIVTSVRINLSKKYKGARSEPDLTDEQTENILDGKLTRRMLLSVTYTCYDVYGMLAPIVS